MGEKIREILIVAMMLALGAYSYYLANNSGYKRGYRDGGHYGVIKTFDTIQHLMDKQIKSDSTVTKIGLIRKDTLVYYLSAKNILDEN